MANARAGYLTIFAFALSGSILVGAIESNTFTGLSQATAHPNEATDSRVVPISVEGGQIIVAVTINGRGPFPMMFDTGSVEAVTPETAAALGLKIDGGVSVTGSGEKTVNVALTHINDMRLGGAGPFELDVPVVPLPHFFTDRGSRPPLAGLVGYGILARFAVRLDLKIKR